MKTIFITGASSGIGAALAAEYACPGNTLILLGRDSERLGQIANFCRTEGAQVHIAAIDVRDKLAMADFLQRMDAETPIDLVIANAGISAGNFTGVEMAEKIDEVFAVNVQGVLNTIHPLLPRMITRNRGHIAIMSSLAGIRALPSAPAYSASKAAVRYYGDALRGTLPRGVDITVICPGWITTPLTAKNNFPMPFVMSAERAARIIHRGISRKKSRLAFPKRLYVPLYILACLPNFLTDFIFSALPGKTQKH